MSWVCSHIKNVSMYLAGSQPNLYQSHFYCSWVCSQTTILPFRHSFWMNLMTMHISSWTLLTSTAKLNLNTLFMFCNNEYTLTMAYLGGCAYCTCLKLSFYVWLCYSVLIFWSRYCVKVLQGMKRFWSYSSGSVTLPDTLDAS